MYAVHVFECCCFFFWANSDSSVSYVSHRQTMHVKQQSLRSQWSHPLTSCQSLRLEFPHVRLSIAPPSSVLFPVSPPVFHPSCYFSFLFKKLSVAPILGLFPPIPWDSVIAPLLLFSLLSSSLPLMSHWWIKCKRQSCSWFRESLFKLCWSLMRQPILCSWFGRTAWPFIGQQVIASCTTWSLSYTHYLALLRFVFFCQVVYFSKGGCHMKALREWAES